MGMIRVMLLVTDLGLGGTPLRLARLAPRLRDVGVEPVVGCLAEMGPVGGMLEAAGIETFSCDALHRSDVGCIARLVREVRRRDPDLIHSFLFHSNLAARLAGRLDRPRPVVTTTVTVEVERPLHRIMESLTIGLSDRHVANSQAVAAHLCEDLGVSSEQIVVIPNAIDLEAIRNTPVVLRSAVGIPESSTVVVWAGRMDPVKDLATWVRTMAEVQRSGVDARGLLLGDGSMRASTLELIEQLGLRGVVHWTGWTGDVIGYMKMSDILLLPSRTEGSPNVLLEALACGCAAVVADIPACREALNGMRQSRLCPLGDVMCFSRAVMELAEQRMSGFCEDRDLLRRRLEEMDLPRIVKQWGDFYRTLG